MASGDELYGHMAQLLAGFVRSSAVARMPARFVDEGELGRTCCRIMSTTQSQSGDWGRRANVRSWDGHDWEGKRLEGARCGVLFAEPPLALPLLFLPRAITISLRGGDCGEGSKKKGYCAANPRLAF
jgi:hypothetical protein